MSSCDTLRTLLLDGRHKLCKGRTDEVFALVCAQPRKAARLIECLWDEDHGVANRAADVAEMLFAERPTLFERWAEPLLGLLAEAEPIKVRWRLAGIVPRLALNNIQRDRAFHVLESLLDDRSSIVKTCALDGLAALALRDASIEQHALDLLRIHSRSGTPAMRARGRKLLKALERRTAFRSLGVSTGS